MSVASWLLSVFTTQTPSNYKSAIDGNFAVAQRIVDKFAPRQSNTPAMTVTLDAGNLFKGLTLLEVAAQTTGTITAPVTNPRIDRVVIDKVTGAVSVITGTPAGSPVAPALTASVFPVAQVLLQTTSTTITNTMITDERISEMTSMAAHISAAPSKATPVGADAVGIWDSVTGLLNKLTLTNLAAYLATVCSAGWNAATATTATTATSATSATTATTAATVSTTVASGAVGTTQASNDSSTKIATTAFANPAVSKASSGYVKFPSGVIMQWGTVSVGANTTAAVTFPTAFPTATGAITLLNINGGQIPCPSVTSVSTSGFTASNSSNAAFTYYWTAIGY
jgi:hypothetical protein